MMQTPAPPTPPLPDPIRHRRLRPEFPDPAPWLEFPPWPGPPRIDWPPQPPKQKRLEDDVPYPFWPPPPFAWKVPPVPDPTMPTVAEFVGEPPPPPVPPVAEIRRPQARRPTVSARGTSRRTRHARSPTGSDGHGLGLRAPIVAAPRSLGIAPARSSAAAGIGRAVAAAASTTAAADPDGGVEQAGIGV